MVYDRPDYADRLRIEEIGGKHRIWHASFGQDRGQVALIGEVEDRNGSKWLVTCTRSRTIPSALLRHTTPCEAARWIADWYGKEAECLAQQLFQIAQGNPMMRYSESACRRAVDHAGLPEAISWSTDLESLPKRIREWADPVGPVAEPTRPGMPAGDATVRQPGRPLVRHFLDIDCQQPS